MSDDKILMNFSNIVLSYAVNATIHLGLSPDPATGQIAIDLNRAKDLIDICSAFPTGENDDIVDTCTQAWLRLRKGWFITHSSDADEDDDFAEQKRLTLYG